MNSIQSQRPLVTFALFAYNQEHFIRDAIRGALSQTYEPLEIILSDDCSSDRTFEIMQEMADAYEGPHQVRLNRSPENLGTLGHLIDVGRKARGSILVVAAGDDISKPERVATLVPYFEDLDVWAAGSWGEIIDKYGAQIKQTWELPELRKGDPFFRSKFSWFAGFTAAYRTSLFSLLPVPKPKVLIEDYPLALLIHLLGKKVKVARRPLVAHRWHESNLSIIRRQDLSVVQFEEKKAKQWAQYACAYEYVLYSAPLLAPVRSRALNVPAALRRITRLRLLARWWDLTPAERIRFLLLSMREGKVWSALSRLFGWRVFLLREFAKSHVSLLFTGFVGSKGR